MENSTRTYVHNKESSRQDYSPQKDYCSIFFSDSIELTILSQ